MSAGRAPRRPSEYQRAARTTARISAPSTGRSCSKAPGHRGGAVPRARLRRLRVAAADLRRLPRCRRGQRRPPQPNERERRLPTQRSLRSVAPAWRRPAGRSRRSAESHQPPQAREHRLSKPERRGTRAPAVGSADPEARRGHLKRPAGNRDPPRAALFRSPEDHLGPPMRPAMILEGVVLAG